MTQQAFKLIVICIDRLIQGKKIDGELFIQEYESAT